MDMNMNYLYMNVINYMNIVNYVIIQNMNIMKTNIMNLERDIRTSKRREHD
jgi:hypothetical protein